MSQFEIMQLMIIEATDHMPSFSAMQKFVQPHVSSDFHIDHLNPGSFDEWLDNIRNEITDSKPIAIATKFPFGAHIRVVIQFDDDQRKMVVFNPGISRQNKQTNGSLLEIRSFVEPYSFQQAENDWNEVHSCKDQLKIARR